MEHGFKTYSVSSFKEFQDIILDIPIDQFTLYRGQGIDKALLPKIARYEVKDVETIEQEMLEDFKRRSTYLIDYHPGNSWDWLALAQHHGMATRLLDWSENPLIALWFSMATKSDIIDADYTVVWGFKVPSRDLVANTEQMDSIKQGTIKVFKPDHITKRITAQFGWFTVHTANHEKHFVSFEQSHEYSKHLFKIKVNSNCFSECKKRLHNYGINSASMYPDIDGLAKHVEWLYLENK